MTEAGAFGDIGKAAAAIVAQQDVPHLHGGDEEVGIAVVVGIGKGWCDTDAVREGECRRAVRNVFKTTPPEVAPQLVASDLCHEVEVETLITVDIRDGDTVPMVVVDHLVMRGPVLRRDVAEADPGFGLTVGENEVVEHLYLISLPQLLVSSLAHLENPDVDCRDLQLLRRRFLLA